MKRIAVLLLLLLPVAASMRAQHAFGVRGQMAYDRGWYGGAEVSVQKVTAWEVDAGWRPDLWQLTALTLIPLARAPYKCLYVGLGGGAGMHAVDPALMDPTLEDRSVAGSSTAASTEWEYHVVFAASIGGSIIFRPLQLSLDLRPEWVAVHPPGQAVVWNLGLSLRYVTGLQP